MKQKICFTEESTEKDKSERKRLKKHVGKRKTDKEKKEESETKRLKLEYRFIGGIILSFAALIGYYFYYISGSKIGRADTYYKTAIDYELKLTEKEIDNESRDKLIKNAEYYYLKALENTDYSFPKYLYKYSEFLLTHKKDYVTSEQFITRALGLHETNAIYHQFYCKLLKTMIEQNGDVQRISDYNSERHNTIAAHIQEATYFLSEENNEKAAIMHIDHALNFCNQSIDNNDDDQQKENITKINEKVDDINRLKISTYQRGAELLQEYGYNKEAKNYWDKGIKEFGKPLNVLYGINCYQQQDFDQATEIFDSYLNDDDEKGNLMAVQVFKARILMEMGEYKKAMAIYTPILPKVGLDPMVYGDIMYILIETNKTMEAQKLMKQLMVVLSSRNVDMTEDQSLKYINMMNILIMGKLNEIEKGNWECLAMTEKYPNSYEVNYFAALYYHRYAKNYDKADRYYRTAISIEDQWAKTYYNYSLLFLQNNDLAQFAKYIKIAYEKNPKIPMIKNLYDEYYDQQGQLQMHKFQ